MKSITKLTILSTCLLSAAVACKPEVQPTVEEAEPYLTYVVPNVGAPGDVVQIFGKNFSLKEAENSVFFGESEATVLASDNNRLYVLVPGNENGDYGITVSVNGKTAAEGLKFTYAVEERDVNITSISPQKAFAGAEIRINGDGFVEGQMSVTFDGTPAQIVSVTPTVLKVIAPEHAKGTVEIVVMHGKKQASAQFTYLELAIASTSPAEGSEGTTVTINGEGFSETAQNNTVMIGEYPCTVTEAGATTLKVIIPKCPGGQYDFTVTTDGKSVQGGSFTYKTAVYVKTVAGTGVQTSTDGKGLAAGLGIVQSLIKISDQEYYITQRGGKGKDAIRKVNITDWTVTTPVPTSNTLISDGHPWRGSLDASGNLIFTAKAKGKILKLAPDGTLSEFTLSEGRSLTTNPMDVLVGRDGKIYVVNRDTPSYISVFSADGTFEKEYSASFMIETALWNKDCTKIFIGANTAPYGIHELDLADGTVKKLAGKDLTAAPTAANYTEGAAADATIGAVGGFALDNDGTLYFSDTTVKIVRKLVPGEGGDYTKGTVSLVAGTPFKNIASDGLATSAQFKFPCGIEILSDGSLLVADGTGYQLRRIYEE